MTAAEFRQMQASHAEYRALLKPGKRSVWEVA
jgi:hypothetical protein